MRKLSYIIALTLISFNVSFAQDYAIPIFDIHTWPTFTPQRPTVILIHGKWAKPSREYVPTVEKLAAEYNHVVDFFIYPDAYDDYSDYSKNFLSQLRIGSIPTSLFVYKTRDNKTRHFRVPGKLNEDSLRKYIDMLMSYWNVDFSALTDNYYGEWIGYKRGYYSDHTIVLNITKNKHAKMKSKDLTSGDTHYYSFPTCNFSDSCAILKLRPVNDTLSKSGAHGDYKYYVIMDDGIKLKWEGEHLILEDNSCLYSSGGLMMYTQDYYSKDKDVREEFDLHEKWLLRDYKSQFNVYDKVMLYRLYKENEQ